MNKTYDVEVGNGYNISKLLAKILKYLEDNTIYAEKIKEVIDSDYSIVVTPIQGKVEIKISNEYTTQLKDTTKNETLQAINGSESINVTQGENNIVISLNEDLLEKINSTISADLENVLDLFEGSDTIIVELNDKNDKIVIELDEFFKSTLATQDDIEQLEQEILALQDKQNKIVDSEEIVIDNETNELMLNNTISNRINKSLVSPVSAPNEVKLVGVDTTNSQQMYGLGDGLTIENGKLKASGNGGDGGIQLYKHRMGINIGSFAYLTSTIISTQSTPFVTYTDANGTTGVIFSKGAIPLGDDPETIYEIQSAIVLPHAKYTNQAIIYGLKNNTFVNELVTIQFNDEVTEL